MENKGLLQSDELYKYILETNVYPQEPEPLKEIRALTASHQLFFMGTSPDAGQMIEMLLKLTGAKKTLELGVYTGYSLLLTALTIPEDGKPDNKGSFDYVYVDADKINYLNYHEKVVKLVKVNGIIVYDNTLWYGSVAKSEDLVPEVLKQGRTSVLQFNKALATDPRVKISMAPLGDGITICRRVY
ncbi:probable caffeoyl-CoA O-methyltransferase At4g26220 isoform X2 [Helianthus annuus]|uniref:probable caffeoyl-CoA O-methyltransferase At4g26220 isoform X2 n=1 Tax=Helianthus annuus TaxID=4232 RepID=UPI000B8F6D90|nr:probable caffeoyl-CoA O-methyltransferase At4g26220 isoform X2 [Helianthus annuus]